MSAGAPGRGWGWWLAVPALAWLGMFFVVPLLVTAAVSLAERGSPVAWEFSGSAYGRLVDGVHLRVLARSLWLGAAATALCLLLGFPLAYFIARRSRRLQKLLYFLVLIPLSANSLVLVFAWISILRPRGYIERLVEALGYTPEEPLALLYTPGAILLGLVYWFLPFMVYPLYASLEKVDWRLLEAAADLGASGWATFRRVLLPLAWPGVVSGSLLVFLQAFCTFVIADLLGGSKVLLVGSLVQQRFLSQPQDWPLGAALSLVMVLLLGLGIRSFLAQQGRWT